MENQPLCKQLLMFRTPQIVNRARQGVQQLVNNPIILQNMFILQMGLWLAIIKQYMHQLIGQVIHPITVACL